MASRQVYCATPFRISAFLPRRSTTATNSKTRHSGRDRSLENAKHELDSEVHKLNKFVKQLRSSKAWLDRREKKVADFETLLSAETSRSETRREQDASSTACSGVPLSSPESSGITDRLDSIEALQQASVERHDSTTF